ncbi:hypothetical protein Deipr_0989 [Deinococcus proteolyticus MRP]|uniref:Uncharacterized protein n=1 Tax=Deinococcus proteolyticus (strain ATCC 35074 / DSM 20540 / JCM 6276 / NBRC 101906 / NCIMB 13154 / VKM Ac-1939 / CCM 2703 / MRP) TaxID=693977 RepID=F0RN03_DEIPM|nr:MULTISPECIES: hypothetical protein [Deinococcus]ADY26145.1 hypothetical protein Deipr_0989 [Deinococcus proteolyticus MRP]MCY1702265.1 hypothetical protein [Deinococcus sp. SL84]
MLWLDLLTEGDLHPRRFDGPASLRSHLLKIERLDEAAAEQLLREGRLDPPVSRRGLRVRPFPEPAGS